MGKYISGAKDRVNITVDYPRPLFDFPDLSGEYGNPREYFRLAVSRLNGEGFYREADELDSHKKDKYDTHFNTLARFLDFTNNKIESEDDEYIYIKIKKGVESIEQPRIFSLKSFKEIQKLINSEHDFSMTNCYGRNHLHYIDDLNSIKLLIEENKQKQWFDIFHLDNFNSTFLHGNRDLFSFAYILDEMHSESPELAERFFYGTNVFGQNAFGEVLKQCNEMFSPKSPSISSHSLHGLAEVLRVMGKIDPKKRDEFILKIEESETNNPKLKGTGYKQIILKAIIEADLPVNEEVKNKKANKI
jgi:hypothetical protein